MLSVGMMYKIYFVIFRYSPAAFIIQIYGPGSLSTAFFHSVQGGRLVFATVVFVPFPLFPVLSLLLFIQEIRHMLHLSVLLDTIHYLCR